MCPKCHFKAWLDRPEVKTPDSTPRPSAMSAMSATADARTRRTRHTSTTSTGTGTVMQSTAMKVKDDDRSRRDP
jgi:hypothetical protein